MRTTNNLFIAPIFAKDQINVCRSVWLTSTEGKDNIQLGYITKLGYKKWGALNQLGMTIGLYNTKKEGNEYP